jgi:glycosyltransferase involved in cell wall biosynthesis
LLSPHNPKDLRAWSGTFFYAYSALQELDPDIIWVDATVADAINRALIKIARKIGIKEAFTASKAFSYFASLECRLRLLFKKGDAIVAITASTHVYALKTSRPIIFVSDATYACISIMYESYFAALPQWLRDNGNAVERAALKRSRHILYASEWARSSAIHDYGIPASAITVMPLGPNIDSEIIDRFKTVKSADFSRGVRLLFVSADWKRKGGAVVLDLKRNLQARGIPCELFLVGTSDPSLQSENGVHVLGRLDKSNPDQLMTLCTQYEQAHFLVLPTSAEAFGVVFSEAQAFGCPSLTYAVGGTTTAVKDGETGFTLPLGASAVQYADIIVSLVNDPARYEAMSIGCRRRYETEANWRVWAQKVMELAAL